MNNQLPDDYETVCSSVLRQNKIENYFVLPMCYMYIIYVTFIMIITFYLH